jgi:hypothetical protein
VVYFSIEMWLPFYLIYTDLAKNLTIRSQEAELAFLLEARSSRLEGKNSFRVRVHKLTAQLEAQLPAGVSRLLEVRSPRLEGNDSFKVKV